MKKVLTGGFVLGLAMVAGTAHAAVINVPADAATIQDAVATSTAGDTIEVAAGTYAENLVVDKSLTIHGAGASSVIDGGGNLWTIDVQSDGVTIDGFTIMGGGNVGGGAGVTFGNHSNIQLLNNTITDNMIGVFATCVSNCLIQGNTFDANNRPGPSGGAGIYVDTVTDGLNISNNEFKNQTVNNPVIIAAVSSPSHTNLTFSNNNIHDNVSGVYVLAVDGGVFSGNVITATDATGLSFSGGNSNIALNGNTITNSARGIRIEDAGYGFGPNSAFTFSGNTFSGNTEYNVGLMPGGYTGTEFDPAPVVTLNGANPTFAFTSNGYIEEGATAVDNMGVSIPVVVSGSVNDTVPGAYLVDYSATDIFGHTATSTRTVNILASSSGSGGGSSSGNSQQSGTGSVTAGAVLGATDVSPEVQAQIDVVKTQLTALIEQLIALLQQQLAAAMAGSSY